MKESHQYYTQIQFEMAISGCLWADFVVFTLPDDKEDEDLFVQHIPFSEEFWQKKLFPSISQFFSKFVVQELLPG